MSRSWLVPSGLRGRFALLVLLAVLPVLATSTLTQVYQRSIALEDFVTHARNTTKSAAADLDRILANAAQLLSLIDTMEQTREGQSDCGVLLRGLLDAHPFLNDVAVTTADGSVRCSAHGSFASGPGAVWTRATTTPTGFAILGSRPQAGSPQRELLLAYRSPERADAPVFVAAFGLAWINYTLDAASIADGTIATVIDQDGTVLFQSTQPDGFVGRKVGPADLERIKHSDPRWDDSTAGLDGVVRRYVSAEWGAPAGRALLLATGSPTGQVVRPYNRILFVELLVLAVATLVALIAAERTGQALVLDPMDALVTAAERVGRGEPVPHVEPRGSVEVQALAAAFNRAAETVRHNHALEERLQHSQRLHAVGQLAGGVAHEFNNMLTVILGYADGLLGEDPTREEVAAIRDAAQRAARLTQQLLAFGRKQVLQPRRVSLNQLVREAMSGLAPMLKPRITVVEQLAADDPHVLVDRQQFQHVFLNVLLNAREAMPDGGTLTLTTSQEPFAPAEGDSGAPGRYGVLRIRDTGAGMDAGTLERALEPFFTTKPFGQSAGLGLSTAYGIVRQSGGQFLLASEPGHGTTVTVALPIADPREEA